MSQENTKKITDDALTTVTTQTWANGRHYVRCVKTIQETADVRTFCFAAEQPIMFFFKPGQFVTLELEINGKQVMRSYTISSTPSVPYSFSITVKRVPGGTVSNWLHDNMTEGTELVVHGPAGNFNCIDFPADKVLFLSGGVGITPVMSMARWFYDTNAEVDMIFSHSARTPSDIIYHNELEYMCSRMDNFTTHLICEKYEKGQAWTGYRGYLDQTKLELIAPDFMEREIFCCGPTPYMNAVKKMLKANGFDMSHYHDESFGEAPPEAEDAKESAEQASIEMEQQGAGDTFSVEFSVTGKAVSILPTETIHTAASRLDIHIPKACGMGICGTCKVKKLEGEVEMDHNGGITDEDVEAGYILTCCSVPKGPVVVEC